MAKKKNKNVDIDIVVELQPEPVQEPEPQEPEPLKLTTEEMLKMQLFEEEAIAGDAKARLLLYQKDDYLRKVDPSNIIAGFIRDIQSATGKHAEAKRKAKELKQSINERLKISLEEYAYNEISGILTKIEQ